MHSRLGVLINDIGTGSTSNAGRRDAMAGCLASREPKARAQHKVARSDDSGRDEDLDLTKEAH